MEAKNPESTKFYDCEGPNSEFVELVSKEGKKFFLKRKYALLSPKMKEMLSGPGDFAKTSPNEITFKEIRSVILVDVCTYLKFKAKYSDRTMRNIDPIFKIQKDNCVELMEAADLLQI